MKGGSNIKFSDIQERYVQIDDFPDYYVTESGQIYSTRPIGSQKIGQLHRLKPKSPGVNHPLKYFTLEARNESCVKYFSIHVLVARYFVDGYMPGLVVNHIDGNNRNNDYKNLEWVSQKENVHKSYELTGIGAVRNFRTWILYDKNDTYIGSFIGHTEVEKYIIEHGLDAAPKSLTRHGKSRGYKVIKI